MASIERTFTLQVPSNTENLAMIRDFVNGIGLRAGLSAGEVAKLELAFRAVKDDIVRTEDGRLQARGPDGKTLQDYLAGFVQENPELLPARIAGGSGAQHPARNLQQGISGGFELDKIKPGMSKEEHDRVRQEIARLASQMLRGG